MLLLLLLPPGAGKTDWGSVLAEWLRKSFPRANITYRNAAIPATPSSYMALCVNQHVAPDADLVLLEYNVRRVVGRGGRAGRAALPNAPARCTRAQVNDGGAQKGDSPIRRAHERLMRKLLLQLVAELQRLGASVVYADCSALILSTGKRNLAAAVG